MNVISKEKHDAQCIDVTLTLLFLREKCITPLKKGKIWSGHSLRTFLGMLEPVFP
jgi:hypothetical protein